MYENGGPPRDRMGHAPPSTYGSRPPTRSRTSSMTVSGPMPRGLVSKSSGTTAMWRCQAAGRAAPNSMP
jgi:hypothetical protein